MAERNHTGWPPSGTETLSIASDDETMTASSFTESMGSLSDIASQPDSLTDEPYHELLQLLQQGAPPQVYWKCVRCDAECPSSMGLLDHHVTSCAYRAISPTAVYSTSTMTALLRQVDPEHPVDGVGVWWVDPGHDGEEGSEGLSTNEEEQKLSSFERETIEESVNKVLSRETPAWLSDKQKKEWEMRKDRKLVHLVAFQTANKRPRGDQGPKHHASPQTSKRKGVRSGRRNSRMEPDFWASSWVS